MIARVTHVVARGAEASGFHLTPAMQRDHRLRILVQSFAPRTREQWAVRASKRLSTLPPLKAPDVFELWCLARLRSGLRTLGWTNTSNASGRSAVEGGASALESHRSDWTKGDFALTLEYNPPVHHLGIEAAPPMHERRMPLLDWAHRFGDSSVEGLVSVADLTPDIVFRLRDLGGEPLGLAIGDATLADPRYVVDGEGRRTKAEKLITYRERIGWRAGSTLVRCAPSAAFVMYPGPGARWEGVAAVASADCVFLFPYPAIDQDPDMNGRLVAILDAMVTAGSRSSGAARG